MSGFMFVTRGGIQHEKLHAIMRDLATASDRSVAVIGGSLVDIALTEALTAHWHREPKTTESLFRPSGALGAFGVKIDLGYLTGLYGEGARTELNLIKNIRNDFAHKLTVLDFKDQSVADRVMNLRFGERYVQDTARDDPDEKPEPEHAGRPIGEWSYWFAVSGRDKAIHDARGRFLLSVQALVYGLSLPLHPAMPKPSF